MPTRVIDLLGERVGGEGGCIIINKQGQIGWAHNFRTCPSPTAQTTFPNRTLVYGGKPAGIGSSGASSTTTGTNSGTDRKQEYYGSSLCIKVKLSMFVRCFPGNQLNLASAQLQQTTVIFTLLFIGYELLYWLGWQAERLSAVFKFSLFALVGGAGLVSVLMHLVGAIDLFYYVSELKLVYHYGQNPYLVTFLPTYANDPFVPFSAFLDWPLVYGPAWVLFGAPVALAGFSVPGWLCRSSVLLSLLKHLRCHSCCWFSLRCGGTQFHAVRWLGHYSL